MRAQPIVYLTIAEVLRTMRSIAVHLNPVSRRAAGLLLALCCVLAVALSVAATKASADLWAAPPILSGPAEGSSQRDRDILFLWSAPDFSVTTFICTLDGAAQSCSMGSGMPYDNIAEGLHVFTLVGNGTNTATVNFRIDRTPPDLTTTAGPAEGEIWTNSSATFEWAMESGASYTCALDTALPKYCASPLLIGNMRSGLRALTITGTDAVGNVGTMTRRFTAQVTRLVKKCKYVKLRRRGKVVRNKRGKIKYKKVCRRVAVRY